MVLSEGDIIKFQTIHREVFGTEISKEAAYEQGIKLVRLMSIIYKPMTQQEFDDVHNHWEKLISNIN